MGHQHRVAPTVHSPKLQRELDKAAKKQTKRAKKLARQQGAAK
jgi:hypothetical protein